jgi:hypothetical protein
MLIILENLSKKLKLDLMDFVVLSLGGVFTFMNQAVNPHCTLSGSRISQNG